MTQYLESARVFMAFCDVTRLKVLEALQGGEMSVGTLLKRVDVRQSTLSYHMRVLLESGVVTARNAGKWTYYSICEVGRQHAIELLHHLTTLGKKDAAKVTSHA